MPTYEYKCSDCNHKFEVFQSIKDEPVKVCESCGGSVKRLISSTAGVIFKGAGFYVNDYRKSGSETVKEANPACASCSAAGGCPSGSAD